MDMAQAGSRIGNLIDKNASTYYSSTESAEEAPEPILEDVALSYDNQSSLPASESGDRNMEVTDEKSVKGVSPYSFAEIPVGFLLCWCKPTRVTNAKDFFQRTSNWTALNKGEFLSSLTVACVLVPEVISYAILAGIPPEWALTTAWIMCILTSIMGCGAKLISGPTASIAVALLTLVQNHGLAYVPYAVMFASFFQMAFGFFRCGEFIRFIPFPVMVGFLNAMALITAIFQIRYFKDLESLPEGDARTYQIGLHTNYFSVLYAGTWVSFSTGMVMLIEALVTFASTLVISKFFKLIPGSLIAILLVTGLEWAVGRNTGHPGKLVGDLAHISTPNLPTPFFLSDTFEYPPINYETFKIVWPTGIALFFVSQIESLLVHRHVSDETKTEEESGASNIALSQGIAQFLSSLLGGMGGTSMLGQSEVLIKSGGQSNLSTFSTGVILMIVNMVAIPAINIIPLGCIAGIMLWAAFNMIRWRAFLTILASFFPQRARDILYLDSKVNRMDTIIMLLMLAMTFFLDVAIGAIVGIALSAFSFVWEYSHRLQLDRDYGDGETPEMVTYKLRGTLFFATANKLVNKLSSSEIEKDPEEVVILMSDAEVFDWSGMLALKRLHDKIQSCGKSVAISSLTATSKAVMEKSSAMWEGVVFFEIEENTDDDTFASGKMSTSRKIPEEV